MTALRLRTLSGLVVASAVALMLSGCLPGPPSGTDGSESLIEPVDFPAPVAAEGGLELSFGDPVWVELASGSKDYLLGVAVLDIIEGDVTYWKNFENSDQFLDSTPYFVIVQRAFTSSDDEIFDLTLWPVDADGNDAYLLTMTGPDGSGEDIMSCNHLALPQPEDPLQRIECVVATADAGTKVAGVRYDGTDFFTSAIPADNPYYASPITWMGG